MYLLLLAFLFAISPLLVGQTGSRLSSSLFVNSVGITNDSQPSSEHFQQLRQEISQKRYGENAEDEIASGARYELQKDGYFKAYVTVPDLRVLNKTPGQSTVAVTLRVAEGHQYRLEHISFSNNRVFASSLLRQAFAINDQDVFDTEKIRLGLEELRNCMLLRVTSISCQFRIPTRTIRRERSP